MSFFDTVERARLLLERNRRVSLRALRREFELDEATLGDLVDELVQVLCIAERDGEVLRRVATDTSPAATVITAPVSNVPKPSPDRTPVTYTPRHLADRILQSRSALEGERKQVTVLFADVKGSMELAAQLDPEEWHSILERFFAILTEGVHRFEGTVNQYTGDGIMALFGAPIAHEDHAQRACYAALHLRESLRDFARDLKRRHSLDFATRIGMNSGEVVVGRIGDDLRMDYTAQGHTVGLAQRMESLASGGSIYISEHTASLAQGYFDLEDLGTFTVKGVNEPVHVHELTGLGTARSRFDISRSRGLSRFVGRDADMQTLESALEQARAGNGQVIGIVAEAGTGKSRLCFEFLERCKAKGISTQVGRAVAHGRNVPLIPMLEVFRAYFGIEDGDPDRVARDRIAGRLLQMDEHFRSLLPVLFEFFGVADPAQEPLRMDAESKKRQLFAVLRKVVQEERTDGQPVTLIEDLHWIDASSEAFLEQWVEAAAGSHSLLVLNFRPEYHAAWMNRSWYRQIPLAPLGAEAVKALLDDLIGEHPSTAGLAEAIHARSGGNPFFTEEIVQTLIESGALTGTRGRYQLATPVSTLQVPATVRALLSARIDRLAEREKQVLQAAAVIGKDFSEPVLQQVLSDLDAGATSDISLALRTLRDGEFLHEVSLYPVAEYTFKHPLTQEVALNSQLQERRRRTHVAVARELEATRAERLDEAAALIAQHYESAGEIEAAARWHRRAALWAGYKDVRAAIHRWERVRVLARQMGDTAESAALLIEACSQAFRVGSWREGGTASEWQALYEEGISAAERAQDLRAMASLKMNYGALRGFSHAVGADFVRYSNEAVRIAERSGDPGLRAGTLAGLTIALGWTGRLAESEQCADEVIALSDGDPLLGVDVSGFSPWLSARVFRAHVVGPTRDPDAALREYQSSRQFALERGFPEMALWSVNGEAILRQALDRPEGLDVLANLAIRLAENRDASAIVGAATIRCAAFESAGDWESLLGAAVEALDLVRAQQVTKVYEAHFLRRISTAHLHLGRPHAARDAATAGVTFMRQSSLFWQPDCYAALARTQLALNKSSGELTATLDEYAELLVRTGNALFEGELHELRALLAEREGQDQSLRSALQAAHAAYGRFGMQRHIERLVDHFGSLDGTP